MNNWREFIVVLLLGFFMGVVAGHYTERLENDKYRKAEIERLRSWSDQLTKALLTATTPTFEKGGAKK